jgi:mRNA interferase MazF
VVKIKRFSVHWFDPDPVKGSELQKVRPGIVISPDEMNDLLRTVLIIPLTTTATRWPFRVPVEIMGQKSNAACDQLRAIDKSRLRDHITELSAPQQANVLSVLRAIIAE